MKKEWVNAFREYIILYDKQDFYDDPVLTDKLNVARRKAIEAGCKYSDEKFGTSLQYQIPKRVFTQIESDDLIDRLNTAFLSCQAFDYL